MKTPISNRKHIVFYGNRNAGKSSVMNALTGQEVSLVSHVKGTTTDTVFKAVELLPFGPVIFVDTGGLDDEGELGLLRVDKAKKTLNRADLALYLIDIQEIENGKKSFGITLENEFKVKNLPYLILVNKIDLIPTERLAEIKTRVTYLFPNEEILYISAKEEKSMKRLRDALIKKLETFEEETPLIGDILPYDSRMLMVVPLDSAAPKGRLILPQVQLLRDALDHGIKSCVIRNCELGSALSDFPDIDLVVTDSQVFKEVESKLPPEMPLTSFSILMARQKGDIAEFLKGIACLRALKGKENPTILIMESCSHNTSHEDIGTVKIPAIVNKMLKKEVHYDFALGHDFPENLEGYDLVIHCGSCMLTRKVMLNRIRACKDAGVPITNYGMILAEGAGILNRATKLFT